MNSKQQTTTKCQNDENIWKIIWSGSFYQICFAYAAGGELMTPIAELRANWQCTSEGTLGQNNNWPLENISNTLLNKVFPEFDANQVSRIFVFL